MARAGRWIPSRARGLRHPAVAWTYTLPVWILLSLAITWLAPAAAYLWTLPLLAAGIALLLAPTRSDAAVRAASVIVLAAPPPSGCATPSIFSTFWSRFSENALRHSGLRLSGADRGRGPDGRTPFFAAVASATPLLRPALATGLALAAVAVTSIAAWMAPAYTYEQPLRRYARVIQEPGAARAIWQVGSLDPDSTSAKAHPVDGRRRRRR